MAGKLTQGDTTTPNDVTLARSYCEGRHAAAGGAASSTNPHTAGTPEALSWAQGWLTWEAAGTVLVYDHCAEPRKLAARTIAATPALLVVTMTCTPDLPLTVFWGDGTSQFAATGDANHTYAAAGTYTIVTYFQGAWFYSLPVTVSATLLRDAAVLSPPPPSVKKHTPAHPRAQT